MFRFSIRDVLWLTVVVAFAICWYRADSATKTLSAKMAQQTAETAKQRAIEKAQLQRKMASLETQKAFLHKVEVAYAQYADFEKVRVTLLNNELESQRKETSIRLNDQFEAEPGIHFLNTPMTKEGILIFPKRVYGR